MQLLSRILITLLGALTLSLGAAAQCPIPDRLDGGPCCTKTGVRLPPLPDLQQESLGICWRDCNVDFLNNHRAELSSPYTGGPLSCGVMRSKLRLRDAAGTLQWRGDLAMQYSRTWLEVNPAGEQYQVWRFLVNGDLIPTAAAGPIPCPVPPCVPVHNNRARFTGYVDWALNCGTGKFSNAWMLSHVCDFIDHAPGFPRAGAFHPDRSYTFVGPAAAFVPGPLQPIEAGGSPFEAVRRIRRVAAPGTKPIYVCEFEEQIQHGVSPNQQFCLCGPAGAQPQWSFANLNIAGACGTSVNTVGGPFVPGFLSMGIGLWVDPFTYPGEECLRWNVGGYDYLDPCTGVVRPEVFYGVTTLHGWDAIQLLTTGPGALLPLTFIDQANSLRGGGAGGTVMNVPFASDHIINLNH